MPRSDFVGSVADHYLAYRRDLAAEVVAEVVAAFGLTTDDVVCDLGCGTGQLAAPLVPHVKAIVAVDPEPDMLTGLRSRQLDRVVPVLGAGADLSTLAAALGPFGAIVIGNALHWMDEASVIAASRAAVRDGGGLAIVTQGPPLWLADTAWTAAVRTVLEQRRGTVTSTCGTDQATLQSRTALMGEVFGRVEVIDRTLPQHVNPDWVIGHLRSAMSAPEDAEAFEQEIRDALAPFSALVEPLRVTVVLGTRHA